MPNRRRKNQYGRKKHYEGGGAKTLNPEETYISVFKTVTDERPISLTEVMGFRQGIDVFLHTVSSRNTSSRRRVIASSSNLGGVSKITRISQIMCKSVGQNFITE